MVIVSIHNQTGQLLMERVNCNVLLSECWFWTASDTWAPSCLCSEGL